MWSASSPWSSSSQTPTKSDALERYHWIVTTVVKSVDCFIDPSRGALLPRISISSCVEWGFQVKEGHNTT